MSSEITERKSPKNLEYSIDFTNEIDDKIRFYEAREKGALIEYAYIKFKDEFIYYKPWNDIDEHEIPKADLNEFMMYLFNKIAIDKMGHRIDIKNKTSKPYFKTKLQGRYIPLIWAVASQKGNFIETFKFLNIKFTLGKKIKDDTYDDKNGDGGLTLTYTKLIDGYITFHTKSLYEQYLVNGFSIWSLKNFFRKEDLSNTEKLKEYFTNRFSPKFATDLFDLKNKIIDVTTEKILKIYNHSSDFPTLLGIEMPKLIFQKKIDDFNDFNTKRIRMGESISHLAYKQIQMALSKYKSNKSYHNAALDLDPDMIPRELMSSGMLQNTKTTNPLDELLLSAKITKAGVGNPLKNQIMLSQRDINETQFGTIAAVTTNEYGGIGLNQELTNGAAIKDRFGSIIIKDFTNNSNPFENMSFSESLMPFQDKDDTTRRIMGNQQFSQYVQLDKIDSPLVQTGFEAYIPYIVSDKFAFKSKKDGKVSVKKDLIHMFYDDGTEEIFSLKPSKARTKRGAYIPLKYNIMVKDGQNVKEGEVIAATNSLKNGLMSTGRNLVVATMGYRGMNYEDGWVISEESSDKFKTTIYERINIIVPTEAKIKNLNIAKDKNTKIGDKLIEFELGENKLNELEKLEDSLEEKSEIDVNEINDISTGKVIKGNTISYQSIGGKIVDYAVYLNNKKVDPKIVKLWSDLQIDIKKKLSICEKLKTKLNKLDCRDKIEYLDSSNIGGHKISGEEFEGALIEIYIEKENPVINGSKFTLSASGGKGTIQYFIPEGQSPVSVDTKLQIEFIPTTMSLISRKNPSILMSLYTGKVIYFLNKYLEKKILEGKINDAKKMAINVFNELDQTKDKIVLKMLDGFFKNDAKFLKGYVKEHDPLQNPAFPLVAPPFKSKLEIKNVEKAAKFLGIPLNEKVYITEEDMTTENKVAVGIMPVNMLEHFAKEMSSTRGSLNTKTQLTSGQGRAGTKEGNGAISVGLYDMFSLASKQPKYMLKEMFFLKSDTRKSKYKMIRSIINGKELDLNDIEIDESDQITKQLVKTYFYGAMLDPDL